VSFERQSGYSKVNLLLFYLPSNPRLQLFGMCRLIMKSLY